MAIAHHLAEALRFLIRQKRQPAQSHMTPNKYTSKLDNGWLRMIPVENTATQGMVSHHC
jgi:hypothetical protein